ncbi:hypothetical protein IWZ03DRAFT_359797 [Phyllosticta citriasiana]|uniref:Uncharacterized protein n=1 Tax=Phyllosticta citriasiana TaxID=595635 RepID=A0ABR1KSD7_9PEZI
MSDGAKRQPSTGVIQCQNISGEDGDGSVYPGPHGGSGSSTTGRWECASEDAKLARCMAALFGDSPEDDGMRSAIGVGEDLLFFFFFFFFFLGADERVRAGRGQAPIWLHLDVVQRVVVSWTWRGLRAVAHGEERSTSIPRDKQAMFYAHVAPETAQGGYRCCTGNAGMRAEYRIGDFLVQVQARRAVSESRLSVEVFGKDSADLQQLRSG